MNESEDRGVGSSIPQERMDAVGELLKRISHDYNNLFGIVIATLGILEEDIQEHPEIAQLKPLIEDALSASKEGTQLMERLLACTGHHSLDAGEVDVADVLAKLTPRIEAELGEGVELDLRLQPKLPRVFADRGALEDAFMNLVKNACEAMPAGGTLKVIAGIHHAAGEAAGMRPARKADSYLSISVSDTGKGIDPAIKGRVMEPFVTSKEPQKSRGFGLSLSYGFARQCNGWLELQSDPGSGTRVTLVLPEAPAGDGESR